MKRKIIGFFVVLTAAFILFALPALAANWQDAGIPQEPVLEEKVYQVSTPEQLAWIAQQVNAGMTLRDETFVLTNDIDLSAREWTPIGFENRKIFEGTFNGRGYAINGLRIGSREQASEKYQYAGLFGIINCYRIMNVILNNAEIYSDAPYVGGIAGRAAGVIQYCTVSGTIHQVEKDAPDRYVGGIVGAFDNNNLTNSNGGGIIGCITKGNIWGSFAGGLAGYNDSYITSCGTTANVSGRQCYGKGIAAKNIGRIRDCYVAGEIACLDPENGFISVNIDNATTERTFYNYELVNEIDTQNENRRTTEQLQSNEFLEQINSQQYTWDESIEERAPVDIFQKDTDKINRGYPIIHYYQRDPNFWISDIKRPELNGNTYLIRTPQELAWISAVSQYSYVVSERDIKLMNNIDLAGKQWIPIYGYSEINLRSAYYGTFDGNYKRIKNMTIQYNPRNPEFSYMGLFGRIEDGSVLKNVGLENVNISNKSYANTASLAAESRGNIINCYATGCIQNNGELPVGVGGLVGLQSAGQIRNCYSMVDIHIGTGSIGGLVCSASFVSRCYSTASLSSMDAQSQIGALISYSYEVAFSYLYWDINAPIIQKGVEIPLKNKKGVYDLGDDDFEGNFTAYLKQKETYENWDFENTWGIDSEKNNGFPYLKGFYADEGKVTGIALPQKELSMAAGSKRTLTPSFIPADTGNKRVTWTTSNPAVAVVDQDGTITAVKNGTAVITVRTEEGGYTDSCTVTVTRDFTLGKIKLSNINGGSISSIPSNGQFLVNIEVQNNGSAQKGYLVIAAYDKNDQFVGFSYVVIDTPAGTSTSFGTLFANSSQKPIKKIKAFVWDGLTTIRPLSDIAAYTV